MSLVKTEIQRAIIEMSCMINNDEVIYHFISQDSLEKVLPKLKGRFNDPHIRCVRPVFKEEIQQGLDPTKNWTTDDIFAYIDKHEENPFPKITRALDALYILHRRIEISVGKLQRDPKEAIVQFIAYEYYDCMSGGCSPYSLAMCRYLYEKYGFDLDEEVYPASEGKGNDNGWYTMKMFLEHIEHIPRYETLFPEILALPEP